MEEGGREGEKSEGEMEVSKEGGKVKEGSEVGRRWGREVREGRGGK